MAKPQTLCRLTEGKLLSTFEHFVETWNWIVDCLENLKGDKDVDPKEGSIKVEGLDDGRPVVKGSGGAGGVSAIKVKGTDGVEVEGSSLVFASASDSNVEIKATVDASGVITCTVGVYWVR